ncbi:hypothetical protein NEDG_02001 [Nematocida displodere]|uniref:XPG N-terminal domain-containing protein n=1 Tax=Nematocida displodere TaxID=1805483 RepID=A0A177EHJ7_9MICR|nr:hypothetical protein NEDG_02001 [Nematocida displodere]
MPIRGLDQELTKGGNLHTPSVEILKDGIIGVDGGWFIRKYFNTLGARTPPHGGEEARFLQQIRGLVATLGRIDCKVVWIWSGMAPKTAIQKPEGHRVSRLQKSYARYNASAQGGPEHDSGKSILSTTVLAVQVEQSVTVLLRGLGVEVIYAPYAAAAQGAYMTRQKYLTMFFGSTDYFLFNGGESLITDFFFTNQHPSQNAPQNTPQNTPQNAPQNAPQSTPQTMHAPSTAQPVPVPFKIAVASRSWLLKKLDLAYFKMSESLLLMGCEYCSTVPAHSLNFRFRTVLGALALYGSAVNYIREKSESSSKSYLEEFLTAKACVEYHPVINEHGSVVCLKETDVPCDLSSIFGKKLPDEIYLAFSKGECSREYISGLAFEEVRVLGSERVLASFQPIANTLYKTGVRMRCSAVGGGTKEVTTTRETQTLAQAAGSPLLPISGIPISVQWLVLLLARKDESLLNNIFVFNNTFTSVPPNEDVDWEVVEFTESVRLGTALITDALNHGREKVIDETVSIDPVNGWRMARILKQTKERKDAETAPRPEQAGDLKKNLNFIQSLLSLLDKNALASLKLVQDLRALAASIDGK